LEGVKGGAGSDVWLECAQKQTFNYFGNVFNQLIINSTAVFVCFSLRGFDTQHKIAEPFVTSKQSVGGESFLFDGCVLLYSVTVTAHFLVRGLSCV